MNRVDNSEICPVNKPLKTSFWMSGSWIHPKLQKSEVPRGRNSFCCPSAHEWHGQGWNHRHLATLVLVQHRWLQVLYSMPHNPNLCWHTLFCFYRKSATYFSNWLNCRVSFMLLNPSSQILFLVFLQQLTEGIIYLFLWCTYWTLLGAKLFSRQWGYSHK